MRILEQSLPFKNEKILLALLTFYHLYETFIYTYNINMYVCICMHETCVNPCPLVGHNIN